jgi:Post-segregation antitoxin CcdA
MGRVHLSIPDDLLLQARALGLNLSSVTQKALADEIDRLSKIAELDAYLAELEEEHGPVSSSELAEAEAWADQTLAGTVYENAASR